MYLNFQAHSRPRQTLSNLLICPERKGKKKHPRLTPSPHRKHATKVTKEISLDYDTVVVVSGDCSSTRSSVGVGNTRTSRQRFQPPPLANWLRRGVLPLQLSSLGGDEDSSIVLVIPSRLREFCLESSLADSCMVLS